MDQNKTTQFNVGDEVEVICAGTELFGQRVTIIKIEHDRIWANHKNYGNEYCMLEMANQIFKHVACQHDWTRVTMFRFDSFCCSKCPATRPFDKEKDAA